MYLSYFILGLIVCFKASVEGPNHCMDEVSAKYHHRVMMEKTKSVPCAILNAKMAFLEVSIGVEKIAKIAIIIQD